MKVFIISLAVLAALFEQGHAAITTDPNVLRETCGQDAVEFYRNKYEHGFEKGTTSFRTYFNRTLKTCYVSISIHGYRIDKIKVDSIYMVLYDLDSKKELGSLFQVFGDRDDPNPYCVT